MQAALPLSKPIQLPSLGIAALLLTGISVIPVPVSVVTAAGIAYPFQVGNEARAFDKRLALEMAWMERKKTDTGISQTVRPDMGHLSDSISVLNEITDTGMMAKDQRSPKESMAESLGRGAVRDTDEKATVDRGVNPDQGRKEEKEKARTNVVQHALSWQGVPYAWGGESRSGIDCSALVQKVYQLVGIELPRSSYEQFRVGVGVPVVNLLPGDLVFFNTSGPGASHVGIYLGSQEFLSATRRKVEVQSMDMPYWKNAYRGSRRILNF
ncbi:MAG: C40 family peptidase [Desulfitobacteriaceae bacterium]